MQLNLWTSVELFFCNRNRSHGHSSPKPPLLGCNRLVLSPLWTYIVHLDWNLLASVNETIVPHLNNRCMVPVGATITYWWTFIPLGDLFHTTRSSSEDWGPLIDCNSAPLTLPTIRSLDFLQVFQLLIGNQPFIIQLWSFSWSNMT